MKTLLAWIADIYKRHGYVAALVSVTMVTALILRLGAM
jgi:hypothetical protein